MASSEEELKAMLVDIGSKLEKPPSSVKDLLALLDRVEVYLSRVEQSPSKGIQSALTPTLKALVGDELLRHTDVDVKVAVASCISEITRITAPEVPYDDDLMREVFQLIVSSFESLADKSSPSYSKRTCILETVAKVRSCVVMLDLECDDLILEMFRHFIKAIRDYHPENVFSCMENIMNRVIEESEEISSELLFCILNTVKKDNEEVTPVAHKLMKKVIETSADKLRPYIEIAVRTDGVSLSDYDDVVNHICSEVSAETGVQSEHTGTSVVGVVPAIKPMQPTAVTIPTAEETTAVADNSVEKIPAVGCSASVTTNGNRNIEADALSNSSMMQDPSGHADEEFETVTAGPSAAVSGFNVPEAIDTEIKASEDIIVDPQIEGGRDSKKVEERESKTESKAQKIMKKRGRKSKAKKKTSEPKLAGKSSSVVKKPDELAESHKSSDKDICPSPRHESSNDAAGHSSPKPSETDDVPSKGVSGETREPEEKLSGPSNSKTIVSRSENHTSLDEQTNKSTVSASEGRTTIPTVDASEVKATVSAVDTPLEKTDAPNDENMEQDTTIPASESAQDVVGVTVDEPMEDIKPSAEKSPKQSAVPLEDTHDVEDGPSKTKDGIKKRGRGLGKATLWKRAAKAAAENNNKEGTTSRKPALKSVEDEEDSIKSPKTGIKRKHVEENKIESKDGGEELVGSKVKVWWPADKRFYKGVIESFDSAKNKHKVLYVDGEVEHLVLKKQRWELINPDEDSETEEESDQETPESSSRKRPKGKVDEGSSKKRLGRPPSSKSKSASNKPGRKPNDHPKSGSKSKDNTKTGAKAKKDSPKEVGKSKAETVKKLGRPPRVDASKSTGKSEAGESKSAGKSKADEPENNPSGKSKADESKPAGKSKANLPESNPSGKSKAKADESKPAGKSKADVPESNPSGKSKADESKHTDEATAEDAQSSKKSKGGDPKTSIKGKSDSKTASKPEAETSSVKQKDSRGKGTKSVDETPESAGKSKTRESSKSKSGPAAKKVISKTASAAKRKGKSRKTTPKREVKAPEKADSDSSDSEEIEEAAKEQTPSPAKATGSSKRKAPHSEKGNKGGEKSGPKRKKGRKH